MPIAKLSILGLATIAACSGGADGPNYASEHPRIYLGAHKERLVAGLAAATPSATRFKTMVDRWVDGGDIYGFEPWNAALLGQLTGEAKYCAAAVAATDKLVVAEEQAIASGSGPSVAGDSYLEVGPIIGSLALTYDWCYGAILSDRRIAWLEYANQAVWNVWNPDQATWGGTPTSWSGWAIDDPSNNYYYSFMRATMLLGLAAHGEVDGADAWLTTFHDTKLMAQLVPMFEMDLAGGGSREGTGYGVAMRNLFELYDFWRGSTGEDIATKTGHTRASMVAFIHQVVPTLDRVAPTGDQSRDSTAALFDYHRAYLGELVSLFPKDPVAPRAQAMLAASSVPKMGQQFMYAYDFLYDNASVTPTTLEGLGTAYYASGIGQIYARSGWDTHATWLNFTAGAYTQSHAHQDQGALLLYKDGWLAYDAVIDSRSGLPQNVDAHSTMRLVSDGKTIPQKTGRSSKLLALHRGAGYLHAAADITPMYTSSSVQKVQREVVYLEPDCVVVYDRVVTSGGSQVWQLAMPQRPTINGSRTQMTASGHTLTIERAAPSSGPTATVYDFKTDSDFSAGFRLDETVAAGDHRWLHVIWIDDAVGNVVTQNANSVSITLAGGTVAQVAFDPNNVGGTLTLGNTTVTLGAAVDSLPE